MMAFSLWPPLVIFLSVLGANLSVELPNVTLVVKDENSNNTEVLCVAEENSLNSALGWIYPIPDKDDKIPAVEYYYVPNLKNNFDCSFPLKGKCDLLWKMDNWQNSKKNPRSSQIILDARWEDLQTYLTSPVTREFNSKFDVQSTFHIGVSVRAAKNAELFFCEGHDPHSSPCYYFNVGSIDNKQIYLRKYKALPGKILMNETKLEKYKSDTNVLSDKEWKNFEFKLDENGNISLVDTFKNQMLLNYHDATPFKPFYLLIRSESEKALWKIHSSYNSQYIYTNKANITQLGPPLEFEGTDFCVSLYVSMCQNCSMTFFFYQNTNKVVLKEVKNEKNEEPLRWKHVKLIQHDVLDNKVRLQVETSFINQSTSNGYWAIDDIRVCTQSEIRITKISTNMDPKTVDDFQITCQVVDFPAWRPEHHIATINTSVAGQITDTLREPTSIKLQWHCPAQKEGNHYLIHYEGKDTCTGRSRTFQGNQRRTKSRGYLISNTNSAVIENLIPFTLYNISVKDVVTNCNATIAKNTRPTEKPSKDELPKNVTMNVTETSNLIEWKNPLCKDIHGPLVYQMNIINNSTKEVHTHNDIKVKYTFDSLEPFTNYTLELIVARKDVYLNDTNMSFKLVYNFTTLPVVAPSVQDLELCATSNSSAYFRFGLPPKTRGIPKEVQLRWCYPMFVNRCVTKIEQLQKCLPWKDKYCVNATNLANKTGYKFYVSVKNDKTPSFGAPKNIIAATIFRVPGAPLNLTYDGDCDETAICNLLVNWTHPYNQNGTITRFELFLNRSSLGLDSDSLECIRDDLVVNEEYKPTYSHIIKYISLDAPYKLSVRAVNSKYKGPFTTIDIKAEMNKSVDEINPQLLKRSNQSVVFQLPEFSWYFKPSTLIIIVQDYDSSRTYIADDIVKLNVFNQKNRLCNNFGDNWIAKAINITNASTPLVEIGDGSPSFVPILNRFVTNKNLKPHSEYCFTFVIMNSLKNGQDVAIYHKRNVFTEPSYAASTQSKETDEGPSAATIIIPLLFVALLLVCAAWFGYRYMKRRKFGRGNNESIYEAMPFDDYSVDAVSNQTYDRLIHD